MIFPALSVAVTAYFGYHLLYGPRGLLAYDQLQAILAQRRQEFAGAQLARKQLQHRISLLEGATVDPDLVEELARTELMDGAPGQIAIPRDTH
ncbi:MAG: septum formation initiator family protein [Alphaproteobacteria bacterium]|nr:septum formation initiator family protein [Alphaproteobacteria bacterium]